MNPFSLGLIFTAFTTIPLAFFVLWIKPKSQINRTFSLYSLSIGFWAVFSAIQTLSGSPSIVLQAVRMMHWGAILIPPLFLYFLHSLTSKIPKILITSSFILAVVFLALNYTSLFVSGIQPKYPFYYFMQAGPFYLAYVLFFVICWTFGVVHLYFESKTAKGQKRRQLIFLFIGSLVGYVGGSGAFLPVYNINIPLIYPYGNFAIAAYVLIMAYAIVKHKFLDIEVIIKNTLIFGGIVAAAACLIAFPLALIQLVIGKAIGVPPFLLMVGGIVTSVLIYRPLEKRLIQLTDTFLFQKKFDYQKLLKDASAGISKIESLEYLLGLVVHFVTMRVRVRNAAVLILDTRQRCYSLTHPRGYGKDAFQSNPPLFSEADPLISWMAKGKLPLNLERIQELEAAKKSPSDLALIRSRMKTLKASICVPSFLGKELKSVLILGEKKSGDSYTEEDLNVLFTLAQESAIAIENARLYDEAIEKNKELEEINRQLGIAQNSLIHALAETEQTNTQLQVTQASLLVAERKATMVGMAKAIAHEVNNPLTTVSGRAQNIQRRYVEFCLKLLKQYEHLLPEAPREELKQLILKIEDSAKRIIYSSKRIEIVVKTLTNILRDTKGEMNPLSLKVLIRQAVSETGISTYEENLSGCDIDTNDIQANLHVMGNAEQLVQVFVNLMKNSYEAMGNSWKDRKIKISADRDAIDPNMIRIEFSDNGPGIPAEVLPKIWGQGFSTKEKKGDSLGAVGQGQGLFVCKHMIESVHKGTVTAESPAEGGAKFVMRLPLAEENQS